MSCFRREVCCLLLLLLLLLLHFCYQATRIRSPFSRLHSSPRGHLYMHSEWFPSQEVRKPDMAHSLHTCQGQQLVIMTAFISSTTPVRKDQCRMHLRKKGATNMNRATRTAPSPPKRRSCVLLICARCSCDEPICNRGDTR